MHRTAIALRLIAEILILASPVAAAITTAIAAISVIRTAIIPIVSRVTVIGASRL
jgi:hypothetical protein